MALIRTRSRTLLLALVLAASTSGLLLRASEPQDVGTWAPAGPVADSRTGAAAVALEDGRTLITGGSVDGTPTASVVVYNPATGGVAAVGQLLSPRVGHTATLLEDGRVIVAGGQLGDVISSDLEMFDPATGGSTLIGLLPQPRTRHAAARLADGTVVLFGGGTVDGVVLNSVARVDASGAVSAGDHPMARARSGASATTLIDGRVLVAGGNNGSADLRSAEIYDPYTQTFQLTATQLSVARSGHAAVLLPHNAAVLVAGGSSNGAPQASADLFLPAEFPDPFSWGEGSFAATGAMGNARAGAVGGPAGDGYAFAAGGGSAQAERYRFATIKTDKDDYAPGERAVITGSGWQPNEDVTLLFQEDPAVHDDYVLTVTADGNGNIYHDQWAPDWHDLGVRFYLMAKQGGRQAQTTFTDGQPIITDVSVTPFSPNQPSSAGVKDSTTITAKNQGGGALAGFEIRIRSGSLISGTLVRTFSIGNLASNAEVTRTWDGKDDSNLFVPDGIYTARAFATGAAENDAANDREQIVVDNTNPTVTLLSPSDNATVTGNFVLEASPVDVGSNDANIEKIEFYVDAVLVATDNSSGGGWRSGNLSAASFSNGSHTWFAKAYDKSGNNAESAPRTFNGGAADNTAPTTTKTIGAPRSGASDFYVSGATQFSLSCTDNSGGSGCNGTFYQVVGASASCPSNTDETLWMAYTVPFSLPAPDGEVRLCFFSKDTAGNREAPKFQNHFRDSAGPTLTKSIGTPKFENGGTTYVKSTTPISVAASDGGSGLESCTLKIDAGAAAAYTQGSNFTLPASNGSHTLEVKCKDNLGNESTHTQTDVVDDAAPATGKTVGNPKFGTNDFFVTTGTSFTLSCTDAGSGCGGTFRKIVAASAACPANTDESQWDAYGAPFSLPGPDGEVRLCYFSKDNLGNRESVQWQNHAVDTTAPATTATATAYSAPYVSGTWTRFTVSVDLNATDPASGSGVKEITYSASGANTIASTTVSGNAVTGITFSAEGTTTLKFAAKDNLGNTETENTFTIMIDKTPPVIVQHDFSPAANAAGWHKSDITVRFKATDPLSGLDATCVSHFPDDGAGNNFQSKTITTEGNPVTVNSDGCTDVAGNSAPPKTSASFKLDKTDPSVQITSPADGASSIALSIAVSGTASDALSGIKTVAVNGVATNYSSATNSWTTTYNVNLSCGANTLLATATDYADRTNTHSISVTRLCFTFEYLKPLEQSYGVGSVILNEGKYGRVIPVKGIVKLGGAPQTLADLQGYGLTVRMGVNSVACTGGSATDSVEEYADAGLSNGGTNIFRWDVLGYWIYNLDTKAPPDMAMQINKCYRLDAYAQDAAVPPNKVKISESPYAIFKPVK